MQRSAHADRHSGSSAMSARWHAGGWINWRVCGLLAAGAVIGAIGLVCMDWAYRQTDTNAYCLSCHNHDIPYAEHQQTVHFSNRVGVTPGCVDCHVPYQELVPRMVHKTLASRQLALHLMGAIDTEEEYLAHRAEMRERELASMRATDSAACRNCHKVETMDFDKQGAKARSDHTTRLGHGKTCVDCHEDAGHAVAAAPEAAQEESFDL
jgi:cytochrome c-type protein NapC